MEQSVKFSKLERMQALAERDCVDSLRFMASRLNRLRGELLDIADECNMAITEGDSSQVVTNLYIASGAIERGTNDMVGKLSRLAGCIDAMLQLRRTLDETKVANN